MKLAIVLSAAMLGSAAGAAQVLLGAGTAVPEDPRQQHARFVRFRPADGQVVHLNPPRMSWPYTPEIDPAVKAYPGDAVFALQIAASPDFAQPAVQIESTPINFYNALPVLRGSDTWYWRVCYRPGADDEQWSAVRSFRIADDAVEWDRSALADPALLLGDHPRILLSAGNRREILALRETDERSAELAEYIIGWANTTVETDWFRDFWEDDSEKRNYMARCRDMVAVAFAYLLTGDEKYAGFKRNFLTVASWPKGGYSSPEGAGAADKWSSHLTEYLALIYDWFYDDFTEGERATLRGSLEWRIEHTMWSYAWKRNGGQSVRRGSIALTCSSHPYENLMVTIPGMLAIADESQIARDALAVALSYLVGVTNGFGEDEAWNEGPGYGNGKMKWLTDATWYAQTALPGLDLAPNPAYDAYCDFFARITPVGAQHCSFGNRGINELDWCGSRITNFRRMAMLTGNAATMQNWLETRRRMIEVRGGRIPLPFSPWIDYCLPAYADEPEPRPEADAVRLFPLEGWVTVGSAPPSDYDAQQDAVSMTFHCRPRGGYSHSFRSENAFDIHAYGSTITCGGGTTSNQEFFANHTMSHNTVLVGGGEQLGSRRYSAPVIGRIVRFARGDGYVYWAGDATKAYGYVYWAGDATKAYAPDQGLGRFVRHVLFVEDAYFVIFDDLAVADGAEPTTFQWLYHVYPAVDLAISQDPPTVDYQIGRAQVRVRHVPQVEGLRLTAYRGVEGMVNPITGEEVTARDKWVKEGDRRAPEPADAHHLWVTHDEPLREMSFLAVVVPHLEDDEPPVIEAAGERAVRVSFRGETRTIAFAPSPDADIVVQP